MRTNSLAQCIRSGSAELVREPWTLRVDGVELTVRPSNEHDLAATAVMHRRCSARSMLGRYRLGGRSPAVLALDRQLRQPMSFVVALREQTARGPAPIIATASLATDARHDDNSAEIALLVEDSWQRLGIGRELVRHLAGAAALAGYHDLVAYPGAAMAGVQRLMIRAGTTRMVPGEDGGHLHTLLAPSAMYGLGALRTGRVEPALLG